MSLSTILKRILDSKYKTLVKAGYLNSELKITDAGRIALDHVTLVANEAELVKMAEAKIADEAKEAAE